MPTIRNARGIDIVASKDGQVVNIQVKTNSYGKIRYPMSKGDEEWSDDLYYVCVTLKGEKERPDFYILPSKLVAEYIRETHKIFVHSEPRRRKTNETSAEREKRRKESNIRQFPNYLGDRIPEFKDFSINNHKDQWGILEKSEKT